MLLHAWVTLCAAGHAFYGQYDQANPLWAVLANESSARQAVSRHVEFAIRSVAAVFPRSRLMWRSGGTPQFDARRGWVYYNEPRRKPRP